MTSDPIQHFIEQMGIFTQEDGLPRIAGNILGYLILEGEARTLGEITQALGISKASASTNCRLLADKGALERMGEIGARQDAYRACDKPAESTLEGMAQRFRNRASAMDDTIAAFPENAASAAERAAALSAFFRSSADFLDQWKSWMETTHNPPATTE